MTAGQPYYSTKPFHGMPSIVDAIRVDVQNNWCALAEIAIASYPEPCAQLDHLALLLESHGIVVHRVPAPRPPSHSYASAGKRSSFIADTYTSSIRLNGTANGSTREKIGTMARALGLFPQCTALVYGTRVIEVPRTVPRTSQSDDLPHTGASPAEQDAVDPTNALFSSLENAGVEVVRWPATSPASATFTESEAKLVDIEEATTTDTEDEGPRFSPSDIIIISPTLLITRLSSSTNNKGLEYLWSVLSQPAKSLDPTRKENDDGRIPTSEQAPANPPRATTTLLVRVTEPDAPTTHSSAPPLSVPYSSRASIHSISHLIAKPGLAPYTPLCRALVPIDERLMLYDPALVADGEARRLKSVLDRLQEGSKGSSGLGEMSEIFAGRYSRRDSAISYGTFGSVDRSDDEGWQFISVEGLHLTSILLVSASLALLSLTPLGPAISPISPSSNQDPLKKVSQVLGSLGIRSVSLPFSELSEKGGGVRDAIMVLRRESYVDTSDEGDAEHEQQNEWDQPTTDEEPTEGCLAAITASIRTFVLGLFSNISSATSRSDVSR